MRCLHPEHRRLERVHPEVAADQVMVVARLHAVRAQQARPFRQGIVVGREQAGVAKRAKILAREKREAAECAQAADRPGVAGRADCLRGVLDDRNAVTRGDRENAIHPGAQSEQVNRQDGLRPVRHGRSDALGIDVEGLVDIDQNGLRTETRDRACRGEERIGCRHYLVAAPDAERRQRDEQRVGAR